MFKTYDLFDHRNINDLIPEIIYYYLFQGLSLTAIEYKLFKTNQMIISKNPQFTGISARQQLEFTTHLLLTD